MCHHKKHSRIYWFMHKRRAMCLLCFTVEINRKYHKQNVVLNLLGEKNVKWFVINQENAEGILKCFNSSLFPTCSLKHPQGWSFNFKCKIFNTFLRWHKKIYILLQKQTIKNQTEAALLSLVIHMPPDVCVHMQERAKETVSTQEGI